jgi:hypothetical protein
MLQHHHLAAIRPGDKRIQLAHAIAEEQLVASTTPQNQHDGRGLPPSSTSGIQNRSVFRSSQALAGAPGLP